MKSVYSWVKKEQVIKEKEKVEEKDPFLNPLTASKNWDKIQEEYAGRERDGLPFAWGEAFPFLEIETQVPAGRLIGARVRCSFCFRNKNQKPILGKPGRKKRPRYKVNKEPNVAREEQIDDSLKKWKNVWSSAEGRPIKGLLKRSIEQHVLSTFHKENFKEHAAQILESRKKKKNALAKAQGKKVKVDTDLEKYRLSDKHIADNQFRNFIRSCIIGGHVKCSPRQTFAHIAAGALADGQMHPIYGYNNRSEAAIVNIQVFTGYALRARLMFLIRKSRVIALFSDAESARYDKLLMYGVHLVLNGYCCPLPLCFGLGGKSVTGDILRQTLIDGITAKTILSGNSDRIPELSCDENDDLVRACLEKIRKLNEISPIGMEYADFIKKVNNSLTDGDSKYRYTLLKLLRKDQAEVNKGIKTIKGTWCLNHCLSLGGDDLRLKLSIVDRAIKLITSCRTYIHSSSARSSLLKIICNKLKLRYTVIPMEFEIRFQS